MFYLIEVFLRLYARVLNRADLDVDTHCVRNRPDVIGQFIDAVDFVQLIENPVFSGSRWVLDCNCKTLDRVYQCNEPPLLLTTAVGGQGISNHCLSTKPVNYCTKYLIKVEACKQAVIQKFSSS